MSNDYLQQRLLELIQQGKVPPTGQQAAPSTAAPTTPGGPMSNGSTGMGQPPPVPEGMPQAAPPMNPRARNAMTMGMNPNSMRGQRAGAALEGGQAIAAQRNQQFVAPSQQQAPVVPGQGRPIQGLQQINPYLAPGQPTPGMTAQGTPDDPISPNGRPLSQMDNQNFQSEEERSWYLKQPIQLRQMYLGM